MPTKSTKKDHHINKHEKEKIDFFDDKGSTPYAIDDIHTNMIRSLSHKTKVQDSADSSTKAAMSSNNKGLLIRIDSYVDRKKHISRNVFSKQNRETIDSNK